MGFEPMSLPWQGSILAGCTIPAGVGEGSACFLHPLLSCFRAFTRAGMAGLEPAAFRLTAGCSTNWATNPKENRPERIPKAAGSSSLHDTRNHCIRIQWNRLNIRGSSSIDRLVLSILRPYIFSHGQKAAICMPVICFANVFVVGLNERNIEIRISSKTKNGRTPKPPFGYNKWRDRHFPRTVI